MDRRVGVKIGHGKTERVLLALAKTRKLRLELETGKARFAVGVGPNGKIRAQAIRDRQVVGRSNGRPIHCAKGDVADVFFIGGRDPKIERRRASTVIQIAQKIKGIPASALAGARRAWRGYGGLEQPCCPSGRASEQISEP